MSEVTFQLQPLRVPAGWTVHWNSFVEADPDAVGPDELALAFHEDLLCATHGHGGVCLDLGWHGGRDGAFTLEARRIADASPASPPSTVLAAVALPAIRSVTSRSRREVVQAVDDWLSWYADPTNLKVKARWPIPTTLW